MKIIADRLGRYPIVMAYLFGSEAKGTSGLLSDIDIAVFLGVGVGKPERFDLRLRLSNELASLMKRKIDLVVLNDSPV